MATKAAVIGLITPGAQVVVRDEEWLVRSVADTKSDGRMVRTVGISELVRDEEATFFTSIDELEPVRPEDTVLVADETGGYRRSRLWLEAVIRKTPVPVSDDRIVIGHKQLLNEMPYQRWPAHQALKALRPRILIADAVGLGKTLEIGITLSELIRRGRGERILVVVPKAILEQFQHEMWTRFSIGLVRLDSEGIQRVRQKIPPTRNPFTYFKRVIISIDTLKQAGRYRHQLEHVNWDAVVIDECHNLVNQGTLNNTLAKVLAPRTDALVLASATPHNGRRESFAELARLLDPASITDPKNYERSAIEHLYVQRFKKDVAAEVADNFAERHPPQAIAVPATDVEERVLAEISDRWTTRSTSVSGDKLFPWTLLKSALSSPPALRATVAARQGVLKRRDQTPENTREQEALNTLSALADQITDADSSKLKALVATLQSIGVGPKSETRVVIFTERVDTVRWLGETLPKLLGVPAGAIATLHAGLADTDQMSRIEDFSLADKPVRVLVTTDISSEGVNLHRQCHQLIHFDVPWSLITVQQRNGRIDRYGQRHRPEIRALLLSSRQQAGIVSDEHRVASRLLEREDEARRTLGDVAPILGKYSATDEEKVIQAGLQAGDAITDIVPDGPKGFDLLTWLTGGAKSKASAPTGDLPALITDDWTFVLDALTEVIGDPRKELDMVVETDRRFLAMNPPSELKARLRMLPDEVVHDAKLMTRMKLTADREFAEQHLKLARERKGSGSIWPDVSFIGAHHPMLEWLVDKLLVKFGRNEAPIIGCSVTVPTYCLQGSYTNKRGQPTIVEWLVVEAPGTVKQLIKPLFQALAAAGVGPKMANPGVGRDDGEVRELQRGVRPSVEAARTHMKAIRDNRTEELDARVDREAQRVSKWHELAFDLAATETRRTGVDRQTEDMNRHVVSMRTEGDPFIRMLAVLTPSTDGRPR